MITKAEKMKVQYKKKVKRIADVKAIGLVLDNKGQTVNLYEKRPFPSWWKRTAIWWWP